MNEILYKKKVLLIAPKYFDYEVIIKSKLEEFGASVKLIYENISYFSWSFRFWRHFFGLDLKKASEIYFDKKFNNLDGDYDYVFCIRCEYLTKKNIFNLKSVVKKDAKYVYYQWDSIKNNKNSLKIYKLFDKVLTFDPVDSKKMKWIYRPLFFEDKLCSKQKKDIDVLNVCSLHSERANIHSYFNDFCKKNNFVYKYIIHSDLYYFIKRKFIYNDKIYKNIKLQDMTFKKTNLKEIYKYYARSKCVIDYAHPNQNGFTIRTIEAIRNNCKLISNNKFLCYADFYNNKNIKIFDNNSLSIDKSFISNAKYNKELIKKYSIDNFILNIFSDL